MSKYVRQFKLDIHKVQRVSHAGMHEKLLYVYIRKLVFVQAIFQLAHAVWSCGNYGYATDFAHGNF